MQMQLSEVAQKTGQGKAQVKQKSISLSHKGVNMSILNSSGSNKTQNLSNQKQQNLNITGAFMGSEKDPNNLNVKKSIQQACKPVSQSKPPAHAQYFNQVAVPQKA